MNTEYILCAAIKLVQPRELNCYHENDLKICEIGYRHHDIFARFGNAVSKNLEDQGFYTSAGRFVTRQEALYIAKESGQVSRDLDSVRLYSEDLY